MPVTRLPPLSASRCHVILPFRPSTPQTRAPLGILSVTTLESRLQFSLATQLPISGNPFSGIDSNHEAPFDSFQLAPRDSTRVGKAGIRIERDQVVTIVSLSHLADRDWTKDVDKVEGF